MTRRSAVSSTLLLLTAFASVAQGAPPDWRDDPASVGASDRPKAALAELLETDDFRLFYFLPRLWERHLSEAGRKELLIALLGNLRSARTREMKHAEICFVMGHDEVAKNPHPIIINEDIFTQGGRCAWGICQMIDCGSLPITLDVLNDEGELKKYLKNSKMSIITRLLLPGERDQPRVIPDPAWDRDEAEARRAVDELLAARDYDAMSPLPKRWAEGTSESARKHILATLLERLGSTGSTPLRGTGIMFVLSRMLAEDKPLSREGPMLEQDVYVANGRCAWAIEQMMGCVLPTFTEAGNEDPKALGERVDRSYATVIRMMGLPRGPWHP